MGGVLPRTGHDDRAKAELDKTSLALRAKWVGQNGEHAAAKNAGFLKDDVLISIGGKSARRTESDLMASLATLTKPGDNVAVTVLRDGKKIDLTLPMQ